MNSLPLSQIKFDPDCQSRVRLDEDTVVEYAYRMKDGEVFPPIVVFFDGAEYWLSDGFHRYAARKGVVRERGEEDGADILCDIRQGSRLDAVRYALSANAQHGKRRESGDYAKGYAIAVRCGLCEPHDAVALRSLLACSERYARELTQAAREQFERAREVRIARARDAGATQTEIAQREGISDRTVRNIENRKERHSAVPSGPTQEADLPGRSTLPAALAALDRPALSAWSDAIYALEKIIEAIAEAQRHPVPRKALPRIEALMARATELLANTILEPEHERA